MSEDCWFWRYSLRSAGALNAKTSRREYEGALVRIGSGFACVHPWPELGDRSLDECLADLAGPEVEQTRIAARARECARIDGEAREEGRSLLKGKEIPRSHATLPQLSAKAVEGAISQGFDFIKVKAGRDLKNEMKEIHGFISKRPEVRWRIDFNGTADQVDLFRILEKWGGEFRERLDFLEDPFLYEVEAWDLLHEATGVSLANDQAALRDEGGAQVLVLKPAVDEDQKTHLRKVVTSYLDHPLGQVFAAYEAAEWGVKEVCGLQTHGAFEMNDFSELLGEVGPEFVVPEGTGLGFGELLGGLAWKRMRG